MVERRTDSPLLTRNPHLRTPATTRVHLCRASAAAVEGAKGGRWAQRAEVIGGVSFITVNRSAGGGVRVNVAFRETQSYSNCLATTTGADSSASTAAPGGQNRRGN